MSEELESIVYSTNHYAYRLGAIAAVEALQVVMVIELDSRQALGHLQPLTFAGAMQTVRHFRYDFSGQGTLAGSSQNFSVENAPRNWQQQSCHANRRRVAYLIDRWSYYAGLTDTANRIMKKNGYNPGPVYGAD